MKAWSKIHDTDIIESTIVEWENLLDNISKKEEDYQKYLSVNSRLFFPKQFDFREQLVVEKLKFGAEHISDFILGDGQRSFGFQYTLIEIETPHNPLFTKAGNPSARLNHAIQQIRDWQIWIESNREEAKRIFPSKQFSVGNVSTFKYLIIIGRRNQNKQFQNKLIFKAGKENIEIRSFDYLTDIAKSRRFLSFTNISHDLIRPTERENNDFSNPFTLPLKDAEWRAIVHDARFSNSHIVGNNIKLILEKSRHNTSKQNLFERELDRLGNVISVNEYKIL